MYLLIDHFVNMKTNRKFCVIWTVILSIAAVSAFVEELDDTFPDTRMDEIWLIQFYVPRCAYCNEMNPVWYEVGAELKSLGSPVNVGRIDAEAHRSIAKDFHVGGYPAVRLWKDDMKYQYRGPRTKDGIIDFANRVSGPAVRALTSQQLFQHVMSRHNVLFVYIGGPSPLKGQYVLAAKELIVHSNFFSASKAILPKAVALNDVPAVAVFKDGTYLIYDASQDGSLLSWINRERFQSYLPIDSYTLYAMGDTGKLLALAVVDEKHGLEDSIRYKTLMKKVATEYKEHYSKKFQFGHMDGNEYINGLMMGELIMPSIIVLNMSTDSYFLSDDKVETEEQLLRFMNNVLAGHIKSQGGDGFVQGFRRFVYDVKMTATNLFSKAPLLVYSLVGILTAIVGIVCYFICRRVRDTAEKQEPLTGDGVEAKPLKGPGEKRKRGQQQKKLAEKKVD